PAEHLPDAGYDEVLDGGPAHHFLHRVRKVLDHHQHLGAAIAQLVLELAGRIQRVGVDDRVTGAQHAEEAYRVLQDVGQHQRHARALLEPSALQEGTERGGCGVEIGEGDRLAHAGICRARTKLGNDAIEYVAHRRVFVDVDRGRYAFWV